MTRTGLIGAAVGLGVVGLAAFFACTPQNQLKGTAVYLEISFPHVAVDQFDISAANGGGQLVPPTLRPVTPAPSALGSPQTVHVLLPPADGQATFYVTALFEGHPAANGNVISPITRGLESTAQVVLAVGAGCGECAGCCDGTTCIPGPSAASCGAGGSACIACGVTADACTGGECSCGGKSACVLGQQCLNGSCQCTPESCPDGCCSSGQCIPFAQQNPVNCGNAGQACDACPGTSSSCSEGVCVGSCVCPGGCCSGYHCISAGSQGTDKCGVGGAACEVCPATLSSVCTAGHCLCGSSSECSPDGGEVCSAGVCRNP